MLLGEAALDELDDLVLVPRARRQVVESVSSQVRLKGRELMTSFQVLELSCYNLFHWLLLFLLLFEFVFFLCFELL